MKRQKLELTWIGKEKRPKLEPRILLEDPGRSYHAKHRVADNDIFDNRLIFGDNLLALKALEAEFAGQVKCVFIDPPYNTGSAFTHYDDGLEHSIWLGLMRDRLEIIKRLLADDGSLWITIDDNEAHYLKVLCDEVFGRGNFVSTVIWQKKYAPKSDSKYFSESHDFVLVVAKQLDRFNLRRLPKTEKQTGRYTNRDNDPRGPWKASDVLRNEARDYAIFPVKLPSGREVMPPPGTSWRYTKEKFAELIADNRIWFGVNGDARPAYKRFLTEVTDTIPSTTIWSYDEVGHNDESKKEMRAIFGEDLFATPKPERLLERVLTLATNPGDLVLDSFAGSGTTGAVAHKMGRRWIMVELGEHCHTHIIPRLKKVIDGEDKGGITEAVGWQGGGGFRYYGLAPSLIVDDRWGNPVINPEYNAAMLAEALAKLEGFIYAPSETHWWQHGHSSERDFIYVTTQNLSAEQLQALSDEVGPERSLLVCCAAFHGATSAKAAERWPNLTLKKIPKMVLARCEWGHDDYSLNVANLPLAEPEPAPEAPATRTAAARGRGRGIAREPDLFGDAGGEA
ncbi:MAG: site-specific DNA-methyltransferase [Betaproteobacteria bacterium]|nr:MAG: site-specific DNA-methyltransferase [Betaproteobacteria bacterium]